MTNNHDAFYRETLGVLDRSADPDPDFALRLERLLIEESGADRPPPTVPRDEFTRRRGGRRIWLLPAAAALLVAVVGVIVVERRVDQRTVTGPVTADDTTELTTSSVADPPTVPAPAPEQSDQGSGADQQLAGLLPDGTEYTLVLNRGQQIEIESISGVVVMDIGGGPNAIGSTSFRRALSTEAPGVNVQDRLLTASSGGWVMQVSLYDHVVSALQQIDPDIERVLVDAIAPAGGGSSPGFAVAAPFRWADDAELPLMMAVDYGELVVLRGCGDLAIACSDRRGVQVVPAEKLSSPSSTWDGGEVWIESTAPRRADDPTWLDPGPLDPRGGHQVLWTGDEMIVWGGATSDRPSHLTDGAAFDPITNQWRTLPAGPFPESQTTVAVWADDEMLVLSIDRTAAYDPANDSWWVVGDGVKPGIPIWTGFEVVTVSTDGVFRFDRVTGQWLELEGAFATARSELGFDQWTGESLLAIDGRLFLRRGCSTAIREWVDREWRLVPALAPSIASGTGHSFCPWANQWLGAGGSILMWESDMQPTVSFDPQSQEWTEVSRVPVGGTEGPGGALSLDGRVMAMADGTAIYDPGTGRWSEANLPGLAFGPDLVWTGEEVLMWGGTCCYGSSDPTFTIDAWRWTPSL